MRPILPDSSWYIGEARARRDPLLQLAEHALSRDIATCGLIHAEVGRGIRNKVALSHYLNAWDAMQFIESTPLLWRETLQLAWELDRQGRVLPIQSIHIAACARSVHAVILTHDAHFQEIPGVDATDRIL